MIMQDCCRQDRPGSSDPWVRNLNLGMEAPGSIRSRQHQYTFPGGCRDQAGGSAVSSTRCSQEESPLRHPPSMEGWGAAPYQLRMGVESSGHLVAGQAPWRPLLTPLGHGRLES